MKFTNREELFEKLAEAVVKMDEAKTISLSEAVLADNYSAKDAILHGLAEGMRRVGENFVRKIYFVPEVLVCADTMYKGFEILKEHVQEDDQNEQSSVVIGVVTGDHHDIGKNIVGLMLQSAGFKVYDLGKNADSDMFIQKIKEVNPDIIALSTLMSTTLDRMKSTVHSIKNEFPENNVKIMVGGAPVTKQFAEEIGADLYGEDAQAAVSGALNLVKSK